MSFTNDEDSGGDGRMPPITATITDIGVDYREYDNGNAESRLVVLLKPDSDVFGVQTVILSNNHILKVAPNARDIRVGGPERGFDLEIIGNVIKSGKLGFKAAIWMAKLKALNVKTPEETGDLSELIGIKAVFKKLTYNEAKGRLKREAETTFWVPVEILLTSQEGDVVKPAEDEPPTNAKVLPTRNEDILAHAEGLSESALVAWYEGSRHYDGKTVVPLFMAISVLTGEGKIREKNGIYEVGIMESIIAPGSEGQEDDLEQIEEKEASSPSNTKGGQ